MDAPPIAMPTARGNAPTGVVSSSAEYAVHTRELESLRASHRRVLDDDALVDGAAGLGSTVEVADEAGRTTKYRLIGRRTSESPAHEVSLGFPVGKALVGARTGDVVRVGLPNRRERSLTVLDVGGGAGNRIAKAA